MSLIPNNAVVFSALKQGKKGNSVGKQIYPFFEYHFPSKILVILCQTKSTFSILKIKSFKHQK